jgi:hypothetical protein
MTRPRSTRAGSVSFRTECMDQLRRADKRAHARTHNYFLIATRVCQKPFTTLRKRLMCHLPAICSRDLFPEITRVPHSATSHTLVMTAG